MKIIPTWLRPKKHKYAIDAALLGDERNCAWSNLGLWHQDHLSYPQACEALARALADSVNLNSKDKVLDLGCGQGASLILWKENYAVEHLEAVELQEKYFLHNQKFLPAVDNIHHGSFLNLNQLSFKFKFDVVLCIDAAYHSDVNLFVSSASSVLNSKGRLAFHYLILNSKYDELSSLQKMKLRLLLKAADVNLNHLKTRQQLNERMRVQHFENVEIQNLNESVFNGFSKYIKSALFKERIGKIPHHFLDLKKIQLTAKLCAQLYADGIIEYVQISAKKK